MPALPNSKLTSAPASSASSTARDCFHCGQPLPAHSEFTATIDDELRPMCCPGCAAVAQAIVDMGLSDYYRLRTARPAKPQTDHPWPAALASIPSAKPQTDHPWPAALASIPSAKPQTDHPWPAALASIPSASAPAVPEFLREASVYDHPAVQQSFVRRLDGEVREAALILEGIVCAACVWLNERHLRQLPGVLAVDINYTTRRARLRWDSARIPLSRILDAVQAIGYRAYPYDPARAQEILERERKSQLRRLGVAGVLGMQVMTLAVALYAGAAGGIETEYKTFFQWLSLALTLPVLLYSAQPFFTAAWRDLRARQTGMDLPVALGLTLAFGGSLWATLHGEGEVYYDSVVMFVFFLLGGRYLELMARRRASAAAEGLVNRLPALATRLVSSEGMGRGERGGEKVRHLAPSSPSVPAGVRENLAHPLDGADVHWTSAAPPSLLPEDPHPLPSPEGRGEVGENPYFGRGEPDDSLAPSPSFPLPKGEGGEPRESLYMTETVAASALAVGDCVLIRPGEQVPADGCVIDGRSSVDEALMTGEGRPLPKTAGDRVIAGSLNIESPLQVRVTGVGQNTQLAAMLRLLERAQTEKPALARAADRAAHAFIAVVLPSTALVAAYWWQTAPELWLPIAIAMLVVTCPCALSLATPIALTAATGALARRGVLVTRADALEHLARATHVIFDKTGTLTEGRLRLTHTETFGTLDATHCLRLAAALEAASEHPIARALQRAAGDDVAPARDIVNTPGLGLSGRIADTAYYLGSPAFIAAATGQTVSADRLDRLGRDGQGLVLLADGRALLAAFTFDDPLRGDAPALVADLRRRGKTVLLLSGDHPAAVRRVAAACGIDAYTAELQPADKLARVQHLQHDGAIVAMVGDGVNDAAALAAAHVSIAMGRGAAVTAAAADLILLSDKLADLGAAWHTADKTLRIIRQNIARAAVYNAVALPAAALGYIAPWLAAIGMSASSLIVVVNALRLVGRRRPPAA
jgi:Cu2+-exporting ATPase